MKSQRSASPLLKQKQRGCRWWAPPQASLLRMSVNSPNLNPPCLKNFVKHEFFHGRKLLTLLAATRAVMGTLYMFVFMCSSSDSSPAAFSGVSHLPIASIYKERPRLSSFCYPVHERVTVHTSPFSTLIFSLYLISHSAPFPVASSRPPFLCHSVHSYPAVMYPRVLVCRCVQLRELMSRAVVGSLGD